MTDELTLGRPLLRHRLPLSAYAEPGRAWHVTLGTFDRATTPFADATVALEIMDSIAGRSSYYGAVLHLCCLMPDHSHLIVEVAGKGLVDVVRDLKSVSTRSWWRCGGSGKLWQRSFYDRGMRNIDEFERTVTYVLNNPVRAGLVENWEAYPFICGTVIGAGPEP